MEKDFLILTHVANKEQDAHASKLFWLGGRYYLPLGRKYYYKPNGPNGPIFCKNNFFLVGEWRKNASYRYRSMLKTEQAKLPFINFQQITSKANNCLTFY